MDALDDPRHLRKVTLNSSLANTEPLRRILDEYPDLFDYVAKHIMDDLENSYELSATDLPKNVGDEDPSQQALRESMVESWIKDLDEQLTIVGESLKESTELIF
jgi:hypothetical protein